MRPEDFASDAPGSLVRIPRQPSDREVRAVAHGGDAPPTSAWAFLPDPLPPSLSYDAELASALVAATQALVRLDAVVRDLPNPFVLVRPLLRREAVESSRIEGTIASLDELVVYEEIRQVDARTPDDVREVANYLEALEYALRVAPDRRVSLSLIRELHHLLLREVRGEGLEPGAVRERQNYIGQPGDPIDRARYVPPPPNELPGLLSDLEAYIASDDTNPALVRVALVHYQFEAIHPFLDGNGRVGRLLIALLLHRWGVMEHPVVDLSAYVARHREEYIGGLLRVSQRGDWRGWIDFLLGGLEVQGIDAFHRSRRLLDLREDYRTHLRRDVRSAHTDRLVDHLFEENTVTVRRASELLDVSFTTAQRVIGRLEHRGIVEEATGRRRDRVYRAREIIAVLDGRRS